MLTSITNERVKSVHALQNLAKTRRKENKIVLEGVRLISDAFAAGFRPEYVIWSREVKGTGGAVLDSLLNKLDRARVPLLEATVEILNHLADTDTPQGIIAVVPTPELSVHADPTLLLVLDGVADPGNMGTIFRTAAGAGVDVCVLLPGCVDPFNPKVIRAGMSAHFRLPIRHMEAKELATTYPNMSFYLADSKAELTYDQVDWRRRTGLVVGGEAHGAAPATYAHVKSAITIPMQDELESLNAASAAAVILFEAARQRRVGLTPDRKV